MDIWTAVERLGLPTIGFAVVLLFAVKAARYVTAKVLEPIAASHVALVQSTKESNELNSKTLEKLGAVVITKTEALNHISDQNDQILELAGKNHDLLLDLKRSKTGT